MEAFDDRSGDKDSTAFYPNSTCRVQTHSTEVLHKLRIIPASGYAR